MSKQAPNNTAATAEEVAATLADMSGKLQVGRAVSSADLLPHAEPTSQVRFYTPTRRSDDGGLSEFRRQREIELAAEDARRRAASDAEQRKRLLPDVPGSAGGTTTPCGNFRLWSAGHWYGACGPMLEAMTLLGAHRNASPLS